MRAVGSGVYAVISSGGVGGVVFLRVDSGMSHEGSVCHSLWTMEFF